MSKTAQSKFLRESGVDVFNGNELLVKGALETEGGVHLLTGYPGSPVATFFDVLADLADLLKERGIEGRIANNEALSVAAVNGSQMGPLRSLAAFKSVGLHVASDALALGNLAGPHADGGAVIVAGDDPWNESTQVPADSRFLFRHHQVPVIEPSTPQEIKDYVGAGFSLSRASGLYTGYVLTTPLADGGGSVICCPNHYPLTNANHRFDLQTDTLDLESRVLLPPRTGRRELDLPQRLDRLLREVERLGLNRLDDVPGQNEVAIVTSGMAWQYVRQSLSDLGLLHSVPVLKLAVSYPLNPRQIEPLLARFKHLVIIEERRSFIEEQMAGLAIHYAQAGGRRIAQLWGKQFPQEASGFPSVQGLNVSIVTDRLGRFLRSIQSPLARKAAKAIDSELRVIAETAKFDASISARTPTFCPGCPHRDSSGLLLKIKRRFADEGYMRRRHGRGAVDLVFHGDTGCYTMLMFEPNSQLMHNYSGMGLGGGTGSGIDPFINNKQVVFMGDSTFFHSGLTAISNSIAACQDITYIILANGTTAMTGHQPLPSVPNDLLNRPIPTQEIEQMVRAITGGQCPVIRTDPDNHKEYNRTLEQTILADGVKIIIADKECGITFNRRRLRAQRNEQRKFGFVCRQVHMNVTPEVCDYCLECTNNTGCPGLTVVPTDYGPKVQTDLSWCVNDGACAKVEACPSFEEVIITRRRRPTPRGHKIALEDIPEVPVQFKGDTWRVWLAGVGGMGIGTAGSILVLAGQQEGYHVQFSDKKGLAIRNGAVYSQIVYTRAANSQQSAVSSDAPSAPGGREPGTPANEPVASMVVGYGKADLLIGMDPLEAVRAIDAGQKFRVASPKRTAVVVNTDASPTIRTLMGRDEINVEYLELCLRKATRPDGYFAARVSLLCERIFGTKLYMNITMLGIAWQRGLIPVSLDALKEGIRGTIRADFKKNLRAFDVGRKLVCRPDLFADLFADSRGDLLAAADGESSGLGESRSTRSRSLARTVRAKAAYLNMRLLGSRKALRADRKTTRGGRRLPRSERPGPTGSRRLPDTKLARAYKHMTYTTLRACRELDRETMRDIAIRIYDLIHWGGLSYARRYVDRVRRTFLADDERHGFAATRAVIWNLAKLMLIKDEFFVAHLLTSYEKRRRDRQRYNVNPANGDKMRYRRTFHPRFFGKQIDIVVPHWTLYVLRNMRFLRRIIPYWRHREQAFLAWYEQRVDAFTWTTETEYAAYLEALRCVESVTGYAEIRWPKMASAQSKAERLLAGCQRGRLPSAARRDDQ
ncbi:MAG: indolepyruvate ferredoxin oxidoreductase [Phycisphaerae bacterium]|nr:indolepyruvate ferredoxin oxidoreductase [Phycisphaerae bacterium]